ncbi:hypothetical protein GEMRC1_005728 [Eukaryota sp. GEM-RC1]
MEKLQKLHPDVVEELPVDDSFSSFVFDPDSTLDAIRAYPKGSAGGVSFWTMDIFPNELSSDMFSLLTCLFPLVSSLEHCLCFILRVDLLRVGFQSLIRGFVLLTWETYSKKLFLDF